MVYRNAKLEPVMMSEDNVASSQQTITLKIVDQMRFDIYVVFTMIIEDLTFASG